jgi:hypothetical protein
MPAINLRNATHTPKSKSPSSKLRKIFTLLASFALAIGAFGAGIGVVYATVTISQNIQIGSGTPDLTLDGDDLYVTGTAEVDGTLAAKTGGAATFVVAASDASDRVKNQADYVADGTADDVDIQAAIDALPAAGGKVVLSEGLFNISSAINLRNGTNLEGQGIGSVNDAADDDGTTVLKATTAISIVKAEDVSYFQISDLKIRGGSTGIDIHETGGGADVRFFRLERLVINGVTEGGPNAIGLRIEGTTGGGGTGGFFMRDIHVKRVSGIGILIRHAFDFFGTNVYSIGTNDHAWQIRDSASFQLTNVRGDFAGPAGGGEFAGINLLNVNDATLTNVAADQNNGAGIRIVTSGSNIQIIGGWVRNNGTDTALATHQRAGILVQTGIDTVTIMGVHSYDDQGTPTQQYGMLDIGATHTIIGNSFSGNVIAPIRNITAGAIVRDNHGFVTESSGTSTIPSASTSVTVTHGLSVTPAAGDCSFVGAENPTNSVGTAWIDTYTSTQMTLNIENDPGASNFDGEHYLILTVRG